MFLNLLDALAFAPVRTGEAMHLLIELQKRRWQPALTFEIHSVLSALGELLHAHWDAVPVDVLRRSAHALVTSHVRRAALLERDANAAPARLPASDLADAQRQLLVAQHAFVARLAPLRNARPRCFVPANVPRFRLCTATRPIPLNSRAMSRAGDRPVIVVEPYAWDWAELLRAVATRPCVFAFTDTATLHHAAVLDGLHELLLDRKHSVLVLDRYPAEHVRLHDTGARWSVVSPSNAVVDAQTSKAFEAALVAFASEPDDGGDTPGANLLYRVGRRIAYRKQLRRLGDSRAANLAHRQRILDWYDTHKGAGPVGSDLGAPLDDRIAAVVTALRPPQRTARRATKPIRVAHVVGSLIDHGHAPTRVLRMFVDHHDRDRFDVTVICSDDMPPMPGEWPWAAAADGLGRASETIAALAAARRRAHHARPHEARPHRRKCAYVQHHARGAQHRRCGVPCRFDLSRSCRERGGDPAHGVLRPRRDSRGVRFRSRHRNDARRRADDATGAPRIRFARRPRRTRARRDAWS